MKKSMKKNNKGFSLVELIVVVLIMAIIGVALAPQVMKWVGNARLANDVQTYDSVVAAAQLALADNAAYTENTALDSAHKAVITISSSGAAFTDSQDHDSLAAALGNVIVMTDAKAKVSGASYTIEIYGGKVYRTATAPNGDSVQ